MPGMSSNTSPASTSSSDYWMGLLDSVTAVGSETLRDRLIDVESRGDSDYMPDEADIRAGNMGRDGSLAVAGVPLTTWAIFGAVLIGGVFLLKKVL